MKRELISPAQIHPSYLSGSKLVSETQKLLGYGSDGYCVDARAWHGVVSLLLLLPLSICSASLVSSFCQIPNFFFFFFFCFLHWIFSRFAEMEGRRGKENVANWDPRICLAAEEGSSNLATSSTGMFSSLPFETLFSRSSIGLNFWLLRSSQLKKQ